MSDVQGDLALRFPQNPIVTPADVRPSRPDLTVQCVLNPGAFRYDGRTGLLLRVAERPAQEPAWVTAVVRRSNGSEGIETIRFRRGDPDLDASDPRVVTYRGDAYLTTLSHLRLAWSDDGIRFRVDERPTLEGSGPQETFGIEDCRVTQLGATYCLTYSAVFARGYGVGLITTQDWVHFERHGMILPTPNKDSAVFPEKIGGAYRILHRPTSATFGGSDIWTAQSPDLLHWGDHRCIACTRPGQWDSARIGAGAAPILTDHGWLAIYHGADDSNRYCLGVLLLDHDDPTRVIARGPNPVMEPSADYERRGFFGNVVFSNGHVVDGDRVTVYYGASDEVVCGAELQISALLDQLNPVDKSMAPTRPAPDPSPTQ